jgi:hypothetical protein
MGIHVTVKLVSDPEFAEIGIVRPVNVLSAVLADSCRSDSASKKK